LRYRGNSCKAHPDRQGKNLIFTRCLVRLTHADNAVSEHQLFGSIIERGGRFKFVSYANEF
jgi:hypothetical protein